ncbi:MAG: hypothetical protein R3B52_01110 [Candidatus Paceibacterota bacterium]
MSFKEKSWGRYFMSAFLCFIIFAVASQLYRLSEQRAELVQKIEEMSSKEQSLLDEKERVGQEIEYFQNQENLEKEIKARFNYRRPEEKMLIIINE